MKPSRDIRSPAQCRAARALLEITVDQVAKMAGVDEEAVIALEAGIDIAPLDVGRISEAFRRHGIIGIPSSRAGEGARFKAPTRTPLASWG